MQHISNIMKHIPNIMSAMRLILCPVFIYVFFVCSPVSAFFVFAAASLLDVFDGFLARKFNAISNLGKILDPVADKCLQLSAVVCFTLQKMIPLFVLIVLGIKELMTLIGGGIISKKRKEMVYSNVFGKIASFFISASLCLMFFTKDSFLEFLAKPISVMLFIAVGLSIISLFQYAFFTLRKGKNKADEEEKATVE